MINNNDVNSFLLKFILMPFFVMGVITYLVNLESGKRSCKKICVKEKGYLKYLPVLARSGGLDSCLCTEKENNDGTLDKKAALIIRLNERKHQK